jgi:hypothetical protein
MKRCLTLTDSHLVPCFAHNLQALEFLKRAVSAKHPEAMYRFGQMSDPIRSFVVDA